MMTEMLIGAYQTASFNNVSAAVGGRDLSEVCIQISDSLSYAGVTDRGLTVRG